MTTTIAMLERLINSEVENLHLRVDRFEAIVEKIFDRFDIIDRHIMLLWSAVDELREQATNFVTKEDAHSFLLRRMPSNLRRKTISSNSPRRMTWNK